MAASAACRVEDPASTTNEQSWHPHGDCVQKGKPKAKPRPRSREERLASDYAPSRVTGWGPGAQASLVDELLGVGQIEVAGLVARCCASPLASCGVISVVERPDGKRSVAGLCHCGRMLCAICAPYLMGRRLEGLEPLALKLASDSGLRHFLLTLTVRHYLGADWKELVVALRKMQTAIRQGHQWRDMVEGYIRLLESTFGKNGHHPHEHLLVSIRADQAWDPTPFFTWIENLCTKQAAKADRSCVWATDDKGKPLWWSEVQPERLVAAVRYYAEGDKMGTSTPSALREVSSAATKHQPIWTIPGRAYAEVYRGSKNMRWFAVAGVWASEDTAKTDEELNEEREVEGETIAHIPVDVWNGWTPAERRDRMAIIYDRTVTREQVLIFLLACGALAGPPPDPWAEAAA